MFDAYIFDFDLTLADTASGIVVCCNHALEKMGHSPSPPEDIFVCIGKTVEEMYLILTGNDNPADGLRFHENWRQKANEVGNEGTQLFPDTFDVLKRLKILGKKTAIVSNKTTHRIESVLRDFNIDGLIDIVLGIELYDAPKPFPDGLLAAMKKLSVPAESTIYIGDSLVDMRTADNACVSFAAITTGATAAGAFRIAGAKNVFSSLTELTQSFE